MMSWILAAIGRLPALRNTLAFKGGTALRKCYFNEYRFSEDLDFTARRGVARGGALERLIQQAADMATGLVNRADTGEKASFDVVCERYTEKRPHPSQEAFILRTRMPWQRQHMVPVKVEITVGQQILARHSILPIIHHYDEPLSADIPVYSLREIVAEKLHAVLYKTNQLGTRNWDRVRPRDYYDLWRILTDHPDRLDPTGFHAFLKRKIAGSGLDFLNSDDLFDDRMIGKVDRRWVKALDPLIPHRALPDFTTVIDELRPRIDRLISAERPT